MMTAQSIPAASAAGYADYLESRTTTPERGDYYLGSDGAPAEAPGRWLTPGGALGLIGVRSTEQVAPDDLRALMAGRRPDSSEEWLRRAGADGQRAGGIDVTFSAPKSVSVIWALTDADARRQIEAAHRTAVNAAVDYLRATVATTTRWDPERRRNVPARARELHAAEFLHTTARGVAGHVPDPQLHSHVVITSVGRADGSVAAIRSRPVLRSAREVGAYYRATLADELRDLGHAVEQADPKERYFRVCGVPETVDRSFSKRTAEVHRAAQQFRATHGREPIRGELRSLAVHSRDAKLPTTRDELDAAWRAAAAEHGFDVDAMSHMPASSDAQLWRDRVERLLTAERAIFDERRLRTVALEQSAGCGLSPQRALALTTDLCSEGRVLTLADGTLTTARVRKLEREIELRLGRMGAQDDRYVDLAAPHRARFVAAERLGVELSAEQSRALSCLHGKQRATLVVGAAGTGKGVVIDAAAWTELDAGRRVVGVAVAGRTAQQLAEAAPALAGRCRTIDALLASVERGEGPLTPDTTVYVDEAGMGDTERVAELVRAVDVSGAAIVLVGDHRQLPSVGAGGMFDRLRDVVPTCELTKVHRAADPDTTAAWAALRDGDPAVAMAHYRSRGDLRFADNRVAATDAAARRYDELAREHGHRDVALMTDASNAEVDALNLRVQALRLERDELRDPIGRPDGACHLHVGDRVCFGATLPLRGEPRVENGTRGEIRSTTPEARSALVELDGSGRHVTVAGEELDGLRLGYAGHVYRQQGATVDHAVIVTGGWQTARESAYVEASRAREGAEWFVAREELDVEIDADRVEQLSALMRCSRAQVPSLAHELEPAGVTPDVGPEIGAGPEIEP